MYVTVLSGLITTAPWTPCVTPVTEAVPANASLANTPIVTAVSSSVLPVSSTTSAIAATVTVTVAVSVEPAEVTVY